jgi:hypothetical protein
VVLITPHFVFVHMPKTGGSFIRELLLDGQEVGELHATWNSIPPEYEHLPIFAVIRNPWDWYVSWHHFQAGLEDWERDEWLTYSSQGRLSFEMTVLRACGESIDRPHWHLDWMHQRDWDYYTLKWWLTFGMLERRGRTVEVGRFENLREDFIAFLDRHELSGNREAVLEAPAVNPSERGPYQDYYSSKLRDLVGHKSRVLIEKFGYEF